MRATSSPLISPRTHAAARRRPRARRRRAGRPARRGGRRRPGRRRGRIGRHARRCPRSAQTAGRGGEQRRLARPGCRRPRAGLGEHVQVGRRPAARPTREPGRELRAGSSSDSTQPDGRGPRRCRRPRGRRQHRRPAWRSSRTRPGGGRRAHRPATQGRQAWRRRGPARRSRSIGAPDPELTAAPGRDDRRPPRRRMSDGDRRPRRLRSQPCGALLGLALAVAALEPVDAATGVDQLLLAGVEGVALAAQLDVQVSAWSSGW